MIENSLYQYQTDGKYIDEKSFVLAMQSVEQYQNQENNKMFLNKLFKRFDKD